jgi:hypothetical protein
LDARKFGTMDAIGVLSTVYNEDISILAKDVADFILNSSPPMAIHLASEYISQKLDNMERCKSYHRAIETILVSGVSLDEFNSLRVRDFSGRVDVFRLARSVIVNDLESVLVAEHDINLDEPNSIRRN